MRRPHPPATLAPNDHIVTLADARKVAVAAHGDPEGRPVFLLHGTPASRLGHEFAHEPARQRELRVICPDRPGIGRSDPQDGRTVASYGYDVVALADALGVADYAVIGYSCGGPYALACGAAAAGAGRVLAVATMAGAGPTDTDRGLEGLGKTDVQMLRLSQKRPWAARLMLRTMAAGASLSPKSAVKSFAKEVSEVDRKALEDAGPAALEFFVEALRQGAGAVVEEYRVWGGDWGFRLEDVRVPVHLWQGDADKLVPMHHAEWMAARLPDATVHSLPGEGHVSIQKRIGEILDSVYPR